MNNTAYAAGPVLGRFPSVWDGTPASEPSGPRHAAVLQYWLGKDETRELDADTMPDADGVTNILDNGANDVADNDKADDGSTPTCAADRLPRERAQGADLQGRRAARRGSTFPQRLVRRHTRTATGTTSPAAPTRKPSPSSGSQDWAINPASILAGGFIDTLYPRGSSSTRSPEADAWLRFTLSESPAVCRQHVGRQPARRPRTRLPGFFKIGETEDYYRKGQEPGQPGQHPDHQAVHRPQPGGRGRRDRLTASPSPTWAAPRLRRDDRRTARGRRLVGPPTVTEVNPSVTPLLATFNPSIGPSAPSCGMAHSRPTPWCAPT
ncbi:MAG: hypothetical protein R2856_38800 [Caldilineaceae bacterium]